MKFRKICCLLVLVLSICILSGCNGCDGDEPAPAPSPDISTSTDVVNPPTSTDVPIVEPPVDVLTLLGSVLTACLQLLQIEFTIGVLTFSFWQLFLYSICAGVVLYLIFLWVKK